MTAPTLFPLPPEEEYVLAPGLPRLDPPRSRLHDPQTSHEAAATVRRGNAELIKAIRWYVSKQGSPKSAFDIADALCGARWQHDTVRTAVSRAGLHRVDSDGRTPGGRRCTRYVIEAL